MTGKISKIGIIGAGTMGAQIGAHAASYGYDVSIYDPDKEAFGRSLEVLKKQFILFDREPVVPLKTLLENGSKIKLTNDLGQAVREADLVIEAVPEHLELKRTVFEQIDSLAPKGAILATNSSSIPISKIESATKRPEKCLNIHFYIPTVMLNMVDIMGGTMTAPETVEAGKAWIRSIACVPLTVKKEILGFCFNRVWRAIKRETLYMWAEGYVDFRDVDRAWMIFTDNPSGPFALMDAVGLDVIYNIEMVYYTDSKDHKDHPPSALKDMVDRKELGVKTGRGFYTYPDPEYKRPDFLK